MRKARERIYAPDWPVYRELRGVYLDLPAAPPGPVTTEFAQLVEVFRVGDYAAERRAAFRAKFCYLDDGRAAERVVRRVFRDR